MRNKALLFFFLVLVGWSVLSAGEECTTAIISGRASTGGVPLLWKNRDTGHAFNKVIFVKESPYSYLALVNHDETSGRNVYAGVNSAGFAIINSMAYNLPQDPGESRDLEGIIMADALRKCRTVDDFERYIRKNLGPSLGSRSNFGVIDARGGSALFEVHNHGYKRFDAEEFPGKYMVSTNFSRSGKPYGGYGYLRFERALQLFQRAERISPFYILQTVARDVGNALVKIPPRNRWSSLSPERPFWIYTNDSIDRASTASAVVFQGVRKGEDPSLSLMWVILGEPLTSIAIPLWVKSGGVPGLLWDGDLSPIDREAMRIKKLLRPLKGGSRPHYLDLTRLDNKRDSGWLPIILKKEAEIFTATEKFLEKPHTSREFFEFEVKISREVYRTLKSIR